MTDATSTATAPAPVIVGAFDLNASDVVRVELGSFNGRDVIGFRKWFRSADGSVRPTSKGLTVAVRHLPNLARLANEALARARADGLIEVSPEDREAQP